MLLQFHHGWPKIGSELLNVFWHGATPAINRLIFIGNHHQVAFGHTAQQSQELVLCSVDVLVFVNKDIANVTTVFGSNGGCFFKYFDSLVEQIIEVEGGVCSEFALVRLDKINDVLDCGRVVNHIPISGANLGHFTIFSERIFQLYFIRSDNIAQVPGRVIESIQFQLSQTFNQNFLLRFLIENGKVLAQPDFRCVFSQQTDTEGVKSMDPNV